MAVFALIRDAVMVRLGIKLSPDRMEEICRRMENLARSGNGFRYLLGEPSPQRFGFHPRNMYLRAVMVARKLEVSRTTLEEFRRNITSEMRQRIIQAGEQPK